MFTRLLSAFSVVLAVAACGGKDALTEPPQPLGRFVLGHNIVVTENAQKVPISRAASGAEWEKVVKESIDERLGYARYPGDHIYNLGVSVDGYVLAPPGIPIVASPKSALIVTATLWDDATGEKLNAEAQQITVMEELSGTTIFGSGFTRSKSEQMEVLAFNVARRIEAWLLEHPEWFGMTPEEQTRLLEQRSAQIAGASAAAIPEEAPQLAAVPSP